MTIKDIYKLIDNYAPFSLSDELVELQDLYDNSGIMIENEEAIQGIVFALDLTCDAVDFAVENGCNLIVTHHPAIYHPIKSIGGALYKAASNKIGVISCHLNLDCAKTGVDFGFADNLGAKEQTIITPLKEGGYGRYFEVEPMGFEAFIAQTEKYLSTRVLAYGDKNKTIKTVASYCGAGLGIEDIEQTNADLYCSADVPHHVALCALERGACVMELTHYASEIRGITDLYGHVSALNEIKEQNIKTYFFDDERFSQSK